MKNNYVSDISFENLTPSFQSAEPFHYLIIDNFLKPEVADAVSEEFPSIDDEAWRVYNNQIEVKKLLNYWDKFGPKTYSVFSYLNSPEFVASLEPLVGEKLYADVGLNGGGLHTHRRGGKLNTHLDYSIHPKLGLERRLNLLVYVSKDWQVDWGGSLGLWEKNEMGNGPGRLSKSIDCVFNRAVLFDTTQDSWHGLPEPITCPEDRFRNSLAVYYLCEPRPSVSERGKALFAPYKEQANDAEVLDLIKRRSSVATASSAYGDKK